MLAEKVSAQQGFNPKMVSQPPDPDAFDAELESVVHAMACGATQSYHWIKRTLAALALKTTHPTPRPWKPQIRRHWRIIRISRQAWATSVPQTTPILEGR